MFSEKKSTQQGRKFLKTIWSSLVMADSINPESLPNIALILANHQSRKKIIATTTIQTSKGKGSSPLELEGFKSCLHELESYGFRLKSIATDRNAQITKWLRENRVSIEHCFDCWHFSKNIKIKLRKLIKRKGCKIIQEWIKQIGNHLFWCAENCNGDAETLRQMWKSLLLHVINKHRVKRVHPKYPKCQHKTYTKRESLKKEVVC